MRNGSVRGRDQEIESHQLSDSSRPRNGDGDGNNHQHRSSSNLRRDDVLCVIAQSRSHSISSCNVLQHSVKNGPAFFFFGRLWCILLTKIPIEPEQNEEKDRKQSAHHVHGVGVAVGFIGERL